MFLRIIFVGTFFAICEFNEIGMQTPIIHKNDGNTKSAGWMPFHDACSNQWYLPQPLFANIIATIAKPRNASKLTKRLDLLSFFRSAAAASPVKWLLEDVDVSPFVCPSPKYFVYTTIDILHNAYMPIKMSRSHNIAAKYQKHVSSEIHWLFIESLTQIRIYWFQKSLKHAVSFVYSKIVYAKLPQISSIDNALWRTII